MKSFVYTLFAVLMVCALAAVSCATDVIGDVYGEWTLSGSPYYVIGDVSVPQDSTLIIDAGVEVSFWGYYKFNILDNATLKALGTEGDSVVFTTPWTTSGWHGLRFNNAAAACSLAYCVFEYGKANAGSGSDLDGGAIWCTTSSPTLYRCWIRNCTASDDGGGVYFGSNSNATVNNCIISGNSAGDAGGGMCCDNSDPTISETEISGNSAYYGGGIRCQNSSDPTISTSIISGNLTDHDGGGISCNGNSNPNINQCIISGNSCYTNYGNGGGIECSDSSPTIDGCVISNNSTGNWSKGGGIRCGYGSPIISNNTITGNTGKNGGGIACELYSHPTIINNTINGNSANTNGGGIHCENNCNPTISDNIISGNSADNGGGIYCTNSSHPDVDFNEISENHATGGNGGGLYCSGYSNPANQVLNKNTFFGNTATGSGGGIYLTGSNVVLNNTILWENLDQNGTGNTSQIYLSTTSSAGVTYSDIQSSWPGAGNINTYPVFMDTTWDDYRLLWGSPCIDSGDPNAAYNDPDGTVADMGCYYYDHAGCPVKIFLTPYNAPIVLPDSGGTFTYTILGENIDNVIHTVTIWCDVTLPDGSIFGPVLGPVAVDIGAEVSISRVRNQDIPAGAPPGTYVYHAYAVVEADTSFDSFTFAKEGDGGQAEFDSWNNYGESISDWLDASLSESFIPANYTLKQNYPNPFNPNTVISYQLPVAGLTNLSVYDVRGRKVAELVESVQSAGTHEITFDGSGLPSGIYLYRLTAGSFTACGKMVLMK